MNFFKTLVLVFSAIMLTTLLMSCGNSNPVDPINSTPQSDTIFVLDSVFITNNVQGNTQLEHFTYDNYGNPILLSGYIFDTIPALTRKVVNQFDSSNNLIDIFTIAVRKDGTSDTVSWLHYAYTNGKVSSEESLKNDKTVNYKYTYTYDGNGSLIAKEKYVSSILKEYHKYGYDNFQNMVKDTVFERKLSQFYPARIYSLSYTGENKVSKREKLINDNGSFVIQNSTVFRYSNNNLTNTVNYIHSGTIKQLDDSTVYSYDTYQNRTGEVRYNSESVATRTMRYTWKQLVVTVRSFISQNFFIRIKS